MVRSTVQGAWEGQAPEYGRYDVNELDERGFTSGVYCFVECDGGGVNVVPHAGGAMMYLKRIRVAECGQT